MQLSNLCNGSAAKAFFGNGITLQSSRPAYGGRLTFSVSLHCQLARFSIVGRTSRQSWRHPWMRFLENLFALTVDMRLATQGKFAQNAKIISKMQKKESNSELIIVGISLAVGALTSFLAIKIGITSNSWLLIIFIGVALATRPFIRNMLYKR